MTKEFKCHVFKTLALGFGDRSSGSLVSQLSKKQEAQKSVRGPVSKQKIMSDWGTCPLSASGLYK